MHVEKYEKQLPVRLEQDEIERRRREHALAPLALESHAELVAEEASAWDAAKATRKAREKELEGKGKAIITSLCREARVLRDGVELRDVECEDVIVGVMLHTRRLDTGEQVGEARRATKAELDEWEEMYPPAIIVPGGGAAKTLGPAPGNGHEPVGIAEALARALPEICRTPRAETLVHKALAKTVPASTPVDRKAAVNAALEAKHLGEVEGKLVWAPNEKAADDGGIVPDDYQPATTH